MFLCLLFLMFLGLLIAALWSPAKRADLLAITGDVFLQFCSFAMWYPGSVVVLDCIVS